MIPITNKPHIDELSEGTSRTNHPSKLHIIPLPPKTRKASLFSPPSHKNSTNYPFLGGEKDSNNYLYPCPQAPLPLISTSHLLQPDTSTHADNPILDL